MIENIQDIGKILVELSWTVTILAASAAVALWLIGRKRRKEFKEIKEKDFKTILSLMKEKEDLTKEKESLKAEILQALNTLSQKESNDQALLMEMVRKYEESESERKEDLMNWLEFKAQKWQDQIETSMTNRLRDIHIEINRLNKKVSRLEDHVGLKEKGSAIVGSRVNEEENM